MTFSASYQFSQGQRVGARLYSPRFCRRIMRGWAQVWRKWRDDPEGVEQREAALGLAMGWRDRATWPEVLRESIHSMDSAQCGRVMSTPSVRAGGVREATAPPALFCE